MNEAHHYKLKRKIIYFLTYRGRFSREYLSFAKIFGKQYEKHQSQFVDQFVTTKVQKLDAPNLVCVTAILTA